jgi:hypothetical protein
VMDLVRKPRIRGSATCHDNGQCPRRNTTIIIMGCIVIITLAITRDQLQLRS